MKNKNVGYSEFLRAYRRNLIKHPNLICYRYGDRFWFYTQKMVWAVDVLPNFEECLAFQIAKIGILQVEKDR